LPTPVPAPDPDPDPELSPPVPVPPPASKPVAWPALALPELISSCCSSGNGGGDGVDVDVDEPVVAVVAVVAVELARRSALKRLAAGGWELKSNGAADAIEEPPPMGATVEESLVERGLDCREA